jgi:hypothetical protein
MKLITRRIGRLETRVANHEIGVPSAIEILRERRRRRQGSAYREPPPLDPVLYANGRQPTCAEVLRSARARRCVNADAERATTDVRERPL